MALGTSMETALVPQVARQSFSAILSQAGLDLLCRTDDEAGAVQYQEFTDCPQRRLQGTGHFFERRFTIALQTCESIQATATSSMGGNYFHLGYFNRASTHGLADLDPRGHALGKMGMCEMMPMRRS